MILLCVVELGSGPGRCTRRQGDRLGDRAGVAFLKETQSDQGHWDEPAQHEHRLGMTALAGLALMENGVARDAPAISRAREVVVELAPASDQTYDLALAILFLARCQQGRRGEADALIQTLGRRLAGGDHEGIWTYTVPRSGQEPRAGPEPIAPRRAPQGGAAGTCSSRVRETTRTRSSHFWASGRRAGMDSTRTSRWNRSITTFARRSSAMAAGAIGWACRAPIRCRVPA